MLLGSVRRLAGGAAVAAAAGGLPVLLRVERRGNHEPTRGWRSAAPAMPAVAWCEAAETPSAPAEEAQQQNTGGERPPWKTMTREELLKQRDEVLDTTLCSICWLFLQTPCWEQAMRCQMCLKATADEWMDKDDEGDDDDDDDDDSNADREAQDTKKQKKKKKKKTRGGAEEGEPRPGPCDDEFAAQTHCALNTEGFAEVMQKVAPLADKTIEERFKQRKAAAQEEKKRKQGDSTATKETPL